MISEQEINILLRSEQANMEDYVDKSVFEKLDAFEISKDEPGQSEWGLDAEMSDDMPALDKQEDSEMEFSPQDGTISGILQEKPTINSTRSKKYNHLRQ